MKRNELAQQPVGTTIWLCIERNQWEKGTITQRGNVNGGGTVAITWDGISGTSLIDCNNHTWDSFVNVLHLREDVEDAAQWKESEAGAGNLRPEEEETTDGDGLSGGDSRFIEWA
jgi:hypothetical protein